jgi:hypothetical protein
MNDLDRMVVEHECARLIAAYCNAVDRRDHDSVVAMFSSEGVLRRPVEGAIAGHAAIRKFFDDLPPIPRRHVSSNAVVTPIDQDHATAVSYLTAYSAPQANASGIAPLRAPYLIAEYHDRLVREPGGWRFAERKTLFLFRADA